MDIEKCLHLFTKVEDGLPDPGSRCLVVNHSGRIYIDKFLKKGKWQTTCPTHWLDLSKLTKKESVNNIDLPIFKFNTNIL